MRINECLNAVHKLIPIFIRIVRYVLFLSLCLNNSWHVQIGFILIPSLGKSAEWVLKGAPEKCLFTSNNSHIKQQCFHFEFWKNMISVKTNWKLFESSNYCNSKSEVFHGKGESSNSRFYVNQLVCWPFSDCKRQLHDGLCPNIKLANNFGLKIKNNNFHLKYP